MVSGSLAYKPTSVTGFINALVTDLLEQILLVRFQNLLESLKLEDWRLLMQHMNTHDIEK